MCLPQHLYIDMWVGVCISATCVAKCVLHAWKIRRLAAMPHIRRAPNTLVVPTPTNINNNNVQQLATRLTTGNCQLVTLISLLQRNWEFFLRSNYGFMAWWQLLRAFVAVSCKKKRNIARIKSDYIKSLGCQAACLATPNNPTTLWGTNACSCALAAYRLLLSLSC